jgi:hypothetical protein
LSEKQGTEEATPRHPKLDRLASVRAEMARLYREVRAGRLDAGDATKLTYILKEIRCCLEASRLAELEARMNAIRPTLGRPVVFEIVDADVEQFGNAKMIVDHSEAKATNGQ